MSINTDRMAEPVIELGEWPRLTIEKTVSALARAVRTLREGYPGLSERDLANHWRAEFQGTGSALFTDPRAFLMIASGLIFLLDSELVQKSDADPALTIRYLTPLFADQGTPLPVDDHTLLSAIAELGGPINGITRWRVPAGFDEQAVFCLAAHALNAPDQMWAAILPGTVPDDGQAPDALGNPNRAASFLIGAELRLSAGIAQAEARLAAMRAATGQIENTLRDGILDDFVASRLAAVGIKTDAMRAMITRKREYNAASMFKRMLMGPVDDLLEEEAKALIYRWGKVKKQARKGIDELRQTRTKELAGLRQLAIPFQPGPDCQWPAVYRQQDGYIGDRLADFGVLDVAAGVLPRQLWTVEVLAEHDWSWLPAVDFKNQSNVVFLPDNEHLRYADARRAAVSIVLDQMSRALPGRLRLTWLDPQGRGQSAGPLLELLEIDKEIIDNAVWSEPEDIDAALRRVSVRLSGLEQRCLKDTFPDLDAYNAHAGQLAEPHQVVVVTGFPAGFTEDSARRLRQITEAGGRAGISVIVVADPAVRTLFNVRDGDKPFPDFFDSHSAHGLPAWWDTSILPMGKTVFGHAGRSYALHQADLVGEPVLVPCRFNDFSTTAAENIVKGYARGALEAAEVKIEASQLVETGPDVNRTTVHSADVPIGVRGRGDRLDLRLGRKLCHNVLVGGRPGSGKSTLFHTLITSAVRKYPPEELELYLLDFKQGVEFQPYADGQLPHARVVAVESERDFGLSILRRLRDEINERAALLRSEEGQKSDRISEFRERTNRILPRILVVVDEFQVLFADDDRIAHESAQLLDHVIRQGRAFGVHLVLGTQTLRGHGAMSLLRGTLDQVAVRIVLQTSDADSRLFLADDNPAGFGLSRAGEAIYNEDGGRLEGNTPFQVAQIEDAERDAVVDQARADADARGFTRKPRVFDGSRKVTVADDEQVTDLVEGRTAPDSRRIRLHLGLPVAIGGCGSVDLRRMSGNHLAIIHRDPDYAMGALMVALTTAQLTTAGGLKQSIVDCLGVDEDNWEQLGRLSGASCVRRSKLARELQAAQAEVARRLAEDDFAAPRLLLVVNALHRARDLGDENTYPEPDSPRAHLLSVLRDGADVGVHVVVTADSIDTLERRLGAGALSEFGARLLGQCSAEASQRVVGTSSASRLGDRYALLYEPDDDRLETIRPFPVPDQDWLSAAARRRETQ